MIKPDRSLSDGINDTMLAIDKALEENERSMEAVIKTRFDGERGRSTMSGSKLA